MAHAGGRPTDYHGEETIAKVRDYIASCIDEEREIMNADKLTTRLKVKLPSIEGLAVYLDVTRETIYEWRKVHPEFSYIIGRLLATQAERLLSNGLSGDYNSTITKLILTKHQYHDRVDTDITSGGDPIVPIIVERGTDKDKTTSETV